MDRLYPSLRRQWLPVAYASALAEGPAPVTVLEEDLVLARFADGPRAFADRCPHRGAALSLGHRSGDCLRCPYHGWGFGGDGRCVDIPSLAGARIPPAARVRSYRTAEAAGLVWVCLGDQAPGDERPPVPPLAEVDDPTYRVVEVPPYDWACGIGRRLENFVDLTHLPWVHDQTLADRSGLRAPEHWVQRCGREVRMTARLTEYPNTKASRAVAGIDLDLLGHDKERDKDNKKIVTDQEWLIIAPTTLWWRQTFAGGGHFGVLLAASPVGPGRCRTFTLLFRDYATDPEEDADIVDFHLLVAEQDRPVVESQRPREVPLGAREVHLKGPDRMSLAYRQALRELVVAAAER